MNESEGTETSTEVGVGLKSGISLVCKAVDLYAKAYGEPQEIADLALFELAREVALKKDGRASQYLDHFFFGNGAPLYFNMSDLLKEDDGARKRVVSVISETLEKDPTLSGYGPYAFPIRQGDYQDSDWKNALGSFSVTWQPNNASRELGPICGDTVGMDWIDQGTNARWRMLSSVSLGLCRPSTPRYVRVWGSHEYHWHKTTNRADECLHQAGYRLTQSPLKLKFFMMIGNPCSIDLQTGKVAGG